MHISALRRPSGRLLLALGLAGVLALGLLAPVDAASHREAPAILGDPLADNTDVYAFVSPDDPDTVTLIANWIPFQEPGGGPNYFPFGEDVLYEIYVDNDGDAVEDVTYQFRFEDDVQNPNTYLYATGTIESLDDEDYNFRQTMDVWRVEDGERTQIGEDLILPPDNIGPRTTPNYQELAQAGIHDLEGGGQVFAGQRDEGFYIDVASVFDLGGLRPFNPAHVIPLPEADGVDTFAGYNVKSVAIQVPTDELTEGDEPVIGVWSTASRRKYRVFANDSSANEVNRGQFIQVSRLGNPLVNEVVIPVGLKDVFNTLEPSQDAAALTGVEAPPLSTEGDIPLVTDPILAEQITALYGIEVPGPPRNDLVSVYLTGIEGLNQPAEVAPAELLRLNTSIPPVARGAEGYSPLGVVGGDNAGFPNGRRVGDDVTDISLRAVAGGYALTPDFNEAPNNQLSDGVQDNDVPYLDTFPYLGVPHQGYEINNPARVPAQGQ